MKLKIPPAALHDALSFILPAIPNRPGIPVLGNALFRVSGKDLIVIATDVEVEAEVRLDIEKNNIIASDDCNFTLPCRKIKELLDVRAKKAVMVVIENDTTDNYNDFVMKYEGARSVYKITGISADDFPEQIYDTSTQKVFKIESSQTLNSCISSVEDSMASQDVRYFLNGLYLECEGDNIVIMTATDGHRLSQNRLAVKTKEPIVFGEIIPKKMIHMLMPFTKNKDPISVAVTPNSIHAKISKDGASYLLKAILVSGKYPNYRALVRHCSDVEVFLDREELISMCSRILTLVKDGKMTGVIIHFEKDKLILKTSPMQNGKQNNTGEEEMPMTGFDEKSPIEIGVDINYLISPLKKLTCETVKIGINHGSGSSFLLTSGEQGVDIDFFSVLMPMRL